jgi:hypothetical protein
MGEFHQIAGQQGSGNHLAGEEQRTADHTDVRG